MQKIWQHAKYVAIAYSRKNDMLGAASLLNMAENINHTLDIPVQPF